MAFSRRLGVIGILGVSWLVAVGCSDDEDKRTNPGDAGEAGETSTGGKSTNGGSASTAGKAGNATAGKGGTAGNGGTAGSADAGAPPVVMGGQGGMTPVPLGGAAGDAGGSSVAGSGGEAGAPVAVASRCQYTCINDGDCEIPGPITDTSHKCNQLTKRCESPTCDADSDCLATVSDWVTSCDDDSGCFPDVEACVAVDGKGYCASLPDVDLGCFISGVPLTVPRFGAQGEVEVCGSPDARCIAGACQPGCADPDKGGCNPGGGDTCSETTGLCECADGSECASNLCVNSHCVECATSAECETNAQFTGLDVCVNGKCGCSGTDKCPDGGFESASAVCE